MAEQRAVPTASSLRLSRRRFATLMMGSVAASLLSACGGGDGGSGPSPTSTAAQPGPPPATPSTPLTVAPTTPTPSAGEAKRGGTLRVALDAAWRTLDPPVYTNIPDRQVFFAIYDSLVAMDEGLGVNPSLASKWEVSADGMTWTFSLTPGVVFHDGTPFNAEAVKFNLDRLLNPDTGSRLRTELEAIEAVEVLDEETVTIQLKYPFTPLLSQLADVPGMMCSPAAVQEWGEEYGDHPVGTGPFKFQEQVKGEYLRLERFAQYWKPDLPYLDAVEYRPAPDPSVRVAGLRTGTFDLIADVPAQDVVTLQADPNITLAQMQGTRWPLIRLNAARPPLDNKAIRQALNLAVDREAIVRAVYFGQAVPAYGPISPIYKDAYDPTITDYALKYNPDLAKQKLAEGGQPDGFQLTLLIASDPQATRIAEIIKENWAAIGVNVEIVPMDSNAQFDKVKEEDYDVALGSLTPRPDPDGQMTRSFHSQSILNYSNYANPEVDRLLEEEQRLPPGPERTEVFHQLQRLLVDEAPWVYLVFETTTFGLRKAVQGFPLIPDTLIRPGAVWIKD